MEYYVIVKGSDKAIFYRRKAEILLWKSWFILIMQPLPKQGRRLWKQCFLILQNIMEIHLLYIHFHQKAKSSYQCKRDYCKVFRRKDKRDLLYSRRKWVWQLGISCYSRGLQRKGQAHHHQQDRASCHPSYLPVSGEQRLWGNLSGCRWKRCC